MYKGHSSGECVVYKIVENPKAFTTYIFQKSFVVFCKQILIWIFFFYTETGVDFQTNSCTQLVWPTVLIQSQFDQDRFSGFGASVGHGHRHADMHTFIDINDMWV